MSRERFTAPPDQEPLSPERRFEAPEILELAGAPIEVYDVSPENAKETPVLFGLGWSATTSVYRDTILRMAEGGRRVISANAPHGVEAEPVDGYPNAEIRKVAAIIEALNEKNILKVDAVGHSEAGIYLTIAATLHPERFRSLTLVDAAGIVGPDSLKRLAVGFSIDVMKQTVNEVEKTRPVNVLEGSTNPLRAINREGPPPGPPQSPLAPLKVLGQEPLQSIRSVFAIANSDVRNMLKGLREKGIAVSAVHAKDDNFFPIEKVQEAVDEGAIGKLYSVQGTHNSVILDSKRFAPLIEQALADMEEEKKKQIPLERKTA